MPTNLGDLLAKAAMTEDKEGWGDVIAERGKQKQKLNLETLLNKAKLDQSLEAAKQAQELSPEGASVKAGDVSIGIDPFAKQAQQNSRGDAQAAAQAHRIYNQGASKLQDVAMNALEGLKSIDDPNNMAAVGQARALLLKSTGLNRFNEQEAKALLGDSLYGKSMQLLNSLGRDENPLTEAQRRSVKSILADSLRNTKTRHDMLKENAINAYTSSPFASSDRAELLKRSLGGGFSKQLEDATKEAPEVASSRDPNQAPKPGAYPASPTIGDKLKSFLGLGGQQQPQSAPMPQQPSAQMQAPTSDRALVISPNGQRGYVPRAKLQEKLQMGYKLAE